ncbi:MAG: hypothetical protein ABIN18_05165 [Pseudomonadota bacterium]
MEYKEIYRKKLSITWKLKRIGLIVLIVGGLGALSIWTLSQQEGLMVGKVLPGTAGQEILGK